ncbi:hypothetical protein AB4Z50_15055 [Paenibacillus sp. 2TAB26]|uniref:hypothetical protein n=1 Tax=Paenibacillus sp. 2TAB26 TaxID=3233005 RepID=UPI003F9E9611
MGTINVNRSGFNVKVEDSDHSTQIGTIYDNEVWCYDKADTSPGYAVIKFRNSAGQVVKGYMFMTGFSNLQSPYGDHSSSTTSLYDYSSSKNMTHDVFNVRHATTIYKPNASSSGITIPAGGQVAMRDSEAGDSGSSNPDWLLIRYYRTTATGTWNSIYAGTSNTDYHGFVPVGLAKGSTKSTISVYGSW